MDLIAASTKQEGGQHVHGWKNITLLEEEAALENKLIAQSFYFLFFICNWSNNPMCENELKRYLDVVIKEVKLKGTDETSK